MSILISDSHPIPMPLKVANNQLVMGGFKPEQLVAIAGQTPCYIYDSQVVKDKVAQLRGELPKNIAIHYAIKANPMPSLVSKMAQWVDGLDVASARELQIALASGASIANISMAGPGKSEHDIQAAVASGVTINLESTRQFEQACDAANKLGTRAKLAVRVNPDFQLKGAGMKMSGGAQQFGIDVEPAIELIQRILASEHDFIGLHIFTGSQNLIADAIVQAHNGIFALAARIQQAINAPIKKLNIGGGLGVVYFPGEKPVELSPIRDNLNALLKQYQTTFSDTQIIMELGRYLVAEAGAYLCRVVDTKSSQGELFAITDGGLHHHLAASGNFGQVFRKNYPVVKAAQIQSESQQEVHIVGPLCTPLDILAKKVSLPPLQVGDLIAVLQSGAYGFTASPHQFLSHPAPVEILV